MYNDDNKFDLYLAQINDGFSKDPVGARELIEVYLDSVDYKNNQNTINIGKYSHILLLILVCVAILLLGLFNFGEFTLYAAGFVFFIVGMLIGTLVPKFGLIFLVSHGMTGFGLMINALNITDYTVLLSDVPKIYTTILFILVVGLFVLGIFTAILKSIGKLDKHKYAICYPFISFFFLILVLNLVPQIVDFLNKVL